MQKRHPLLSKVRLKPCLRRLSSLNLFLICRTGQTQLPFRSSVAVCRASLTFTRTIHAKVYTFSTSLYQKLFDWFSYIACIKYFTRATLFRVVVVLSIVTGTYPKINLLLPLSQSLQTAPILDYQSAQVLKFYILVEDRRIIA